MQMMETTSSTHGTSLLLRLQADDAWAWEEFVELYAPLVFHWCTRCQLQSCDAADTMQDVFAAVSNSIHRFQLQPGKSLRGWLWTITHDKIRDHFRKRQHTALVVGGTQANLMMEQVPFELDDAPTGNVEGFRLLKRGLDQIQDVFQEKTWQAFWRSAIECQEACQVFS